MFFYRTKMLLDNEIMYLSSVSFIRKQSVPYNKFIIYTNCNNTKNRC